MATLFGMYPFLPKLYADGGYQGPQFRDALQCVVRQANVEIVKRSDATEGVPFYPSGGLSSDPSVGSTDAASSPKIGNA